ncbi:MAG: DNA gyrase inhibitor YacG [Candidatus Macondimonas sp.]|jgi:hypothetical protein
MSRQPPLRSLRCPHCGKPANATADNAFRPFCSERCKLIDLGAWLGEAHRIPLATPPDDALDPSDEEGLVFQAPESQ